VVGLEVQREHSKLTTNDGCPMFEPVPGTEGLHHYADTYNKNMEAVGK